MRLAPVAFDTTTFKPFNFHNHGEDDFGFGKFQFNPGLSDLINVAMSYSRTRFQVPFDTAGGVTADDHQTDMNSFVNAGWRHLFGDPKVSAEQQPAELFTGVFYRSGSLRFAPGQNDTPSFIFYPDTTNPYNLKENRQFTTIGAKVDLTIRPANELSFKGGVLAQ